jgi:hypothetical protein
MDHAAVAKVAPLHNQLERVANSLESIRRGGTVYATGRISPRIVV